MLVSTPWPYSGTQPALAHRSSQSSTGPASGVQSTSLRAGGCGTLVTVQPAGDCLKGASTGDYRRVSALVAPPAWGSARARSPRWTTPSRCTLGETDTQTSTPARGMSGGAAFPSPGPSEHRRYPPVPIRCPGRDPIRVRRGNETLHGVCRRTVRGGRPTPVGRQRQRPDQVRDRPPSRGPCA